MLEEYRVGNLREDEVQSQQKIMKERSIDNDAHDSSRPAIKSLLWGRSRNFVVDSEP